MLLKKEEKSYLKAKKHEKYRVLWVNLISTVQRKRGVVVGTPGSHHKGSRFVPDEAFLWSLHVLPLQEGVFSVCTPAPSRNTKTRFWFFY